jgi:hypothetical protein
MIVVETLALYQTEEEHSVFFDGVKVLVAKTSKFAALHSKKLCPR